MAEPEIEGFTQAVKRGRGRPRKPDALSNAERQQRHRDKLKRLKRAAAPGVLYRGPYGETWTGRGQMPRWLFVLVRDGVTDKAAYLVQR